MQLKLSQVKLFSSYRTYLKHLVCHNLMMYMCVINV